MNSDQKIRCLLQDYANDAAGRVECAHKLIFDQGRSVGGVLEILKRGSLIPTRVKWLLSTFAHTPAYTPQNAYHTELGVNLAEIMPVDIRHNFELGVGKNVVVHNIWILYMLGEGAVNLFDAR